MTLISHINNPYEIDIGYHNVCLCSYCCFRRRPLGRPRRIPQVHIRRLATTGRAEHQARGLYRLIAIPVTANDEYHEAVLWAGDGAAVAGEAALALWDLADVNPCRIDVAVPSGRRLPRRHDNGRFRVRSVQMGADDIDFVDQVPVVVPAVAIAQVIERGMDGRLLAQAITAAAGRGLLGQLAEARLRVALADRPRGVAIIVPKSG